MDETVSLLQWDTCDEVDSSVLCCFGDGGGFWFFVLLGVLLVLVFGFGFFEIGFLCETALAVLELTL